MGRIPYKISTGDGFSSFTADQWKSFILIYAIPLMWDLLVTSDRNILANFVKACSLLTCRIINIDMFKNLSLQTFICPFTLLGLRSISVIIESNRSVIGFRSVNLIEFTDISVSVNYRSVSVNSVSVSVFLFTEPIYRLYN